MLPLLCLPPSVAISGYLFWYQGQKTVLTRHYNRSYIADSEIPDQSFKSYTIGLAVLGGAYYAQSLTFPYIEGGTLAGRELKEQAMSTTASHNKTNFSKSKQFTGKYMPPKDLLELAKKVAPPIALRVAASSMAFFCAGVVQTYIALE